MSLQKLSQLLFLFFFDKNNGSVLMYIYYNKKFNILFTNDVLVLNNLDPEFHLVCDLSQKLSQSRKLKNSYNAITHHQYQGPVVQSIVSLTSSLRGQLLKCFTAL